MFGRCAIRMLCCSMLLGTSLYGQATAAASKQDPPAFGLVTLKANQTIHLNVTCFGHSVGRLPPDPCHGVAMFHDTSGRTLQQATYNLKPGASGFLEFTFVSTTGGARVGIIPCVLPDPGGHEIPSVEVFDATGNLLLYENAAASRTSEFSNLTNPGVIVGFNPQPDPPGFGLVTLISGQIIHLNVMCFEHPVNGVPPDPCNGTVMLHDAAGDVIKEADYKLEPGQSTSLDFQFVAPIDGNPHLGISPCIIPAEGGRAVPNVEIADGTTQDTLRLINPSSARVSDFQ